MKVPFSTPQTPKQPLPFNNNTTTTTTTAFLPTTSPPTTYEPTSVLDLQHSPSPSPLPPNTTTIQHLENNYRQQPPSSVDLDNLEGWDSILTELGFNDDSNHNPNPTFKLLPSSQLSPPHTTHFASSQPFDHPSLHHEHHHPLPEYPNLNPNFGSLDLPYQPNFNSFGYDFIDDLVRAAQSFESNESNNNQVHIILARLNQQLKSPIGKPLHRVAFYFKEALQRLTSNPTRPTRLSSLEVVNTIQAIKAFSGISPISLFSAFAANQAILEAIHGSSFIHIIDFDIGFGGHWASFMRELIDKSDPNKVGSMVLRITAIIPDEFGLEGNLVRENLSQFAQDLNINFCIDYVMLQSFEILSFKSVKFIEGERIALHLSPSVFHRLGPKFLADLRGVLPAVVVVVDKEVGIDIGTTSFSVNFIAGIEFYSRLLESLEVACGGGFVDCVRRIEKFVLRPRIMRLVEAVATNVARQRIGWREAVGAAGLRVVGFSPFADFQAECLLRRAHIGGFHVVKRHGEMMLYWHDRALVSTSSWKC